MLDSVPIEQVDPLSLRAQIGLVPQKPALFTGSIRDNIAYGSGLVEQGAIINAAKAAYAHDFIEQLPDGYDTLLGEQWCGAVRWAAAANSDSSSGVKKP